MVKNSLVLLGGAACAAALLLSGCAQTSQATISSTLNTPLRFPADSISGSPVSQSDVNRAVAEAIARDTRYPFRQSWNGNFYVFHGAYVTQKPDNHVVVTYAHGNNMSPSQLGYQTTKYQSNAAFSVRVGEVRNNTAIISLEPNVSVTRGTDAIGIPLSALAPTPALESELHDVLSNPDRIIVRRQTHVEGEINVAFNSESTYANFMRKLGKYSFARGDEPKTNDIEKSGAYKLTIGVETIPLFVDVVPYRNGSKVMYKMDVPYMLSASGAASPRQGDIDEAKKQIARVAND
ncbi:hypothetical protein FVF58_08990 [Paraburkholderia panacisoli]|uniref:Lipoprotein n=1 Tax=Paraburkholderia panacisoli TaxID=2603818 RepID=A0A5B0HCK9_9BURK|nr:hypothetical protein [Paraburkholderia panacisoli]KAA1012927.1 hypothetical protein FVF58_08990 [Paraburkholderia panacisoli]